jgi:hypothetical protein
MLYFWRGLADAGPIATEFSVGRHGVPSALGDPKPRRSERAARALRGRAPALLDARCKLTELAAIFLTPPRERCSRGSNALEQPFIGELMVNLQ